MNNVIEVRVKGGFGRVWAARENQWRWAHPDGSEGSEPSCEAAIEAVESIGKPAGLLERLKAEFPIWKFEPYGTEGAVACFPPVGLCDTAFICLHHVAPISSVCGSFYVVTYLRESAVAA